MFELSIETAFAAAHALVIQGAREPVHGHNWHVTVVAAGETLDADGLLVDFHLLESLLAEIVAPMRNNDLARVAPFDSINPSAELVAKHIGDEMSRTARPPRRTPAPARGRPAARPHRVGPSDRGARMRCGVSTSSHIDQHRPTPRVISNLRAPRGDPGTASHAIAR